MLEGIIGYLIILLILIIIYESIDEQLIISASYIKIFLSHIILALFFYVIAINISIVGFSLMFFYLMVLILLFAPLHLGYYFLHDFIFSKQKN